MADQKDHEEAYDRGFQDGKRGRMLDDFAQDVKNIIPGPNPTTAQSYDAGYAEGAKHRYERAEPREKPSTPKKERPPRREKQPKRTVSTRSSDDAPGCSGCFALSLVVTLLFAASTLFSFGPRYGDSRDISSSVGMAIVTLITGLACWIEIRMKK
ncbi:MAG: hypothetical protein QOD99_2817 [Chthoniobacter sp.]|nr:hypothetical protein [Chthoniobacter sp.]